MKQLPRPLTASRPSATASSPTPVTAAESTATASWCTSTASSSAPWFCLRPASERNVVGSANFRGAEPSHARRTRLKLAHRIPYRLDEQVSV